MTVSPADFVGGNYFDKYGSRNPIHRFLMGAFVRALKDLIGSACFRSVLDVGCAAGELGAILFPGATLCERDVRYVGIDLSEQDVQAAKRRHPGRAFHVASIDRLPFRDASFDLVVACEILEHVDDPAQAMKELARVCRSHIVVSVPWEPVWRIVNFARGKYVTDLGNTPGHVQWYSRRAIRRLVETHFDVVVMRRPFPWTALLARPRHILC